MDRYGLEFPAVRAHLAAGARGELPETPKPGDPRFERVENIIVANAQTMLEAAASYLAAQGFTPLILSDSLTGEAREAAKFHAALVRQVIRYGQPVAPPCTIISGGETAVTVRGQGRGGRNSEFLLALALELDGLPGVWALAGDSDGIDGSEDNAGAVIDPGSLTAIGQPEARRCLEQNNSYSFFAGTAGLVMTGPTRTNVNDLRMVLVAGPSG
jgi:hydroxypyruvate reductase